MVQIEKIPNADGKGFTIAAIAEDVERVDAVDYYRTIFVEKQKVILRETLRLKNPPFPMEDLEPFIEKTAASDWEKLYKQIMAEKVPDFLFSTLKADNRKYQERFLRGMKFTPEQLAAFYFKACRELGYTFSCYSSEHLPNDRDLSDMPILVRVESDQVEKVGETPLSDGELRQVVNQRSAIYGKILDNGDEWHCFFITIESAAGKENWKEGQPHYHYISDKFGISREEVVKQLQSKDYRLGSLPHLELHNYRDEERAVEKK